MEAVCTSCKTIVIGSAQWSFPQMALALPLGLMIILFGSGMLAVKAIYTPWKVIVTQSAQWSFPQMALASPLGLLIKLSRSGMLEMEPASKPWRKILKLLHCLMHGQEHPTSKGHVKCLSIPLMV